MSPAIFRALDRGLGLNFYEKMAFDIMRAGCECSHKFGPDAKMQVALLK